MNFVPTKNALRMFTDTIQSNIPSPGARNSDRQKYPEVLIYLSGPLQGAVPNSSTYMEPSTDIKAFQKILHGSKNIIAVAGAGLSAASGIPTFRGSGGMWRKYAATELATPEGFEESPSLVWQFYHYRREVILKAKPNNAHRALAAFSQASIRNQIAPGSNFTLVTQNIDGLSPTANEELAKVLTADDLEPVDVIEMHGRLFDVLCTNTDCNHVEFNTASPICDALAGTEKLVGKGIMDPVVDLNNLPHCSKCKGLARPGVVWFGETPHRMDEIDELVENADLCLVIGTSAVVYPAAGYSSRVKELGGTVAVFNMEDTGREADFLFMGPCEELLPKALGISDNPFVGAFKA